MSFTVDMNAVYQQFANVFSSISVLLWPFIGVMLALFVTMGLVMIFRTFANGR